MNYRMVVINTLACNFQCPGCLREFNRSNHLDLDVFKSAVRQGKEAGIDYISLTGGEPCMHPQFDEMCDYVMSLGMQLTSVTNGWFASRYQRILDYKRGFLTVSLDGPTAEVHDRSRRKGSFERAVALIKHSVSLGKPPQVTTVWSTINSHLAGEMVALLTSIGVKSVTMSGLVKSQYNEQLRLTQDQHRQIHQVMSRSNLQLKIPRCFNTADTKCVVVDRHAKGVAVSPVLTPFGNWAYCCDLPQDLGTPIGSVNTMSLVEAQAEIARISRTLNQHPKWDCDDCGRYFEKLPQVDSSPKHRIISLVPIK